MRRKIIISWIIIVVIFSGILAYSTLYELDSYQTVLDFKFQIFNISISTNTENQFESLTISAIVSNPSQFSSIRLKSISNTVFLNEQGSEYLRGLHWFAIMIAPQKNTSVTWSYEIIAQNIHIFNGANMTNSWNWNFDITVNLFTNLIEEGQYDRSQEFQGVTQLNSE